jgi:hypothetical protein
MQFVDLIHDETTVVDPTIAKSVIESLRYSSLIHNKVQMNDEQVAVFLILLGGSLLVWEA